MEEKSTVQSRGMVRMCLPDIGVHTMPHAASPSLAHIDGTCRQTQETVNQVHGPRGQNEWRRTMSIALSQAQADEAMAHHVLGQVGSLSRWLPGPQLGRIWEQGHRAVGLKIEAKRREP